MTTWTCYENGIEGVYDLMRMLWMYMFTVDKDEYPDFGCWLWDMERSATFYRH